MEKVEEEHRKINQRRCKNNQYILFFLFSFKSLFRRYFSFFYRLTFIHRETLFWNAEVLFCKFFSGRRYRTEREEELKKKNTASKMHHKVCRNEWRKRDALWFNGLFVNLIISFSRVIHQDSELFLTVNKVLNINIRVKINYYILIAYRYHIKLKWRQKLCVRFKMGLFFF